MPRRNILLYQKQPCRAVLGYENEISRSMQSDCKGKQVWFTRLHDTDNGAFPAQGGQHALHGRGWRCDPLPGPEGREAARPAQH